MTLDHYNFHLPETLVALRPTQRRDDARLLIVRQDGTFEHGVFANLLHHLSRPDIVVVNDSRVVPARLYGHRLRQGLQITAAKVEITITARLGEGRFRAYCRPAKRVQPGDRLHLGTSIDLSVTAKWGGEIELAFDGPDTTFDSLLDREGAMPLPPYISGKRPPDDRDRDDYQTVYATQKGSFAAPTAGLHFTRDQLGGLDAAGIDRVAITLHVGPGTFLPVTVDDPTRHKMHPEWASISENAVMKINAARKRGGRLVAVGTTSLRTLETAADENGVLHPFDGETDIFIRPGYRFKTAEVLLTNFHLPRSTLFMLVCAFMGQDVMQKAYAEAIRERYRFYSYGDACLLFRPLS